MNNKTAVIILAAGDGTRMETGKGKLFLEINKKPVLAHTIERFLDAGIADEILVALSKKDIDSFKQLQKDYGLDSIRFIEGGKDRQDSAYKALKALDKDTDYVLIHDGARPFVSEKVIKDCLDKTIETGAAVACIPAGDTIKVSYDKTKVDHTPSRADLFVAQTPQGFSYPLILEANRKREEEQFPATDDASIAERAGFTVALSEGEKSNIKLTTPDDLIYAEALAQVLHL